MPRYFFHLEDGKRIPDDEGTELPDLQAARSQAVQLAGAMLNDHPEEFWNSREWRLVVTDDKRRILFALSFRAIATDELPRSG